MTDAYLQWFRGEITRWITANRPAYESLRLAIWEKMRRVGHPNELPEKGTFPRKMLEAATCEAIRKQEGWPSERQHEAGVRLPI